MENGNNNSSKDDDNSNNKNGYFWQDCCTYQLARSWNSSRKLYSILQADGQENTLPPRKVVSSWKQEMGSFGSSSGFYYWADITILRAGRVNPTAGTLSTNMHSCHLFLCLLRTYFYSLGVKINLFTAEHAGPSNKSDNFEFSKAFLPLRVQDFSQEAQCWK